MTTPALAPWDLAPFGPILASILAFAMGDSEDINESAVLVCAHVVETRPRQRDPSCKRDVKDGILREANGSTESWRKGRMVLFIVNPDTLYIP